MLKLLCGRRCDAGAPVAHNRDARNQHRSGNASLILVAAAGFAVVLGAAGYMLLRPAGSGSTIAVPVAAVGPVAPVAETSSPAPVATPPVVALQSAAVVAEAGLAEQVAAYVAAGEFGLALDLARTADEAQQTGLIKQVVFAQIKAGEFDGALAAIRQIPDQNQRVALLGEEAREEMLAGGPQADFDSLIELIQNETEGPWLDVDGLGGTITEYQNGVRVDPNGLLYRVSGQEGEGRLVTLASRARVADLNADMATPSHLRMVSLTRLEAAVAQRLDSGLSVVEGMKQLAGLSEIQYVFVYPADGEVVIAGPAEGWQYDESGMPVGVESGRPTLQLDDLVTVLRTFSTAGSQVFGCSIDPRAEGLKAIQEFAEASQSKGPLNPSQVRGWTGELQSRLGMQDIRVFGVPADSRVARVIVEADYRMKLIGLGKMDGGSQIPSYFEILAKDPQQASGNLAALRWWMTLNCDEVLHSADRDAFEIRGSGVQCQSENEFLNAQGERVPTGKSEPMNRLFATNFTKHYGDLAKKDPVFADMEGVFDLALVAALIEREQIAARADWDLGVFAAGGEYRPAAYAAPKEVDSVVNHRVYNGRDIVVQVAGGVRADLATLLSNPEVLKSSPRIAGVAAENRAADLSAGRWWWDAK